MCSNGSNVPPEFKTSVVLEALKREETVRTLAGRFGMGAKGEMSGRPDQGARQGSEMDRGLHHSSTAFRALWPTFRCDLRVATKQPAPINGCTDLPDL